MALEAVVDNWLAGRRDLDNREKARSMSDYMIRDTRKVQFIWGSDATRFRQTFERLMLREMIVDQNNKARDGRSGAGCVQTLAKSFSANAQTLNATKGTVEPRSSRGRTVAGDLADADCCGQPPAMGTAERDREYNYNARMQRHGQRQNCRKGQG